MRTARPGPDCGVPALVLAMSVLAGCDGSAPRTVTLPTSDQALLLKGDRSLLTMRTRPDGSAAVPVMCVQPGPDWVAAVGRKVQLTGSGSGGGASGSLQGDVERTETITALDGRTAGVVALRDGLYEACRAYAAGIIGLDAYALILSQYGDLLVALTRIAPAPGDAAAGGTAEPPGVKALLVACLSAADPTRAREPAPNLLLTGTDGQPSPACRAVVAALSARAGSSAPPPPHGKHR